MGLVSEQSKYNLMDRMIELEVVPACAAYGLGLIPYSPLAGGLLGGDVFSSAQGRRADETSQKRAKEKQEQIEAYYQLCNSLSEQPATVALAWLLKNPVVTAPIIGPRTMEQLDGCQRALEIDLDDETMARLDQIWPGPGGQAPEAYAW